MVYKKRDNPPGAQKGNKNRVALKTADVRQMAYDQYCAHLAKGKSKKSWVFRHGEITCTWETMDKYLENEVEFPPIKKRMAEAEGLKRWEQVVEDTADGTNRRANVAALQMLMRNKFGWDKPSVDNPQAESAYNKQFEALMRQISGYQKPR